MDFEKQMSRRKMQNWPFPGYKWGGLGTFDYLIEELETDEDSIPILPEVPKDLERECGQLLWCCYDVPYPILLVDQVNQMLLTTPTTTPGQPLVPLELYESTWKQIQPILRDHLQFHFSRRPQGHPFDRLQKKCTDLIAILAVKFRNKPREQTMIEEELRNAANRVSLYHIMNTRELQKVAGLVSPNEEEFVTMRRFESQPPTSSESKTSAD
ncbi:MAG: hypothetical protein GY861_26880, partial [bacterium]|nr:hypothetical protein [bacterium]